jgi:hypothetical protein
MATTDKPKVTEKYDGFDVVSEYTGKRQETGVYLNEDTKQFIKDYFHGKTASTRGINPAIVTSMKIAIANHGKRGTDHWGIAASVVFDLFIQWLEKKKKEEEEAAAERVVARAAAKAAAKVAAKLEATKAVRLF